MERNKSFVVRMTTYELLLLDSKVRRTGMSRECYVRNLCNGKTPVEIPPADYHALIREVRELIDAPMESRAAERVIALADKLAAVCLPRDTS